jgi:hypothetical protein
MMGVQAQAWLVALVYDEKQTYMASFAPGIGR